MKQHSKIGRNSSLVKLFGVVESLPKNRTADVIGRQLLRSGTSIGANYRAACRGKSKADLFAKLAIVEEEADETSYWLELLLECDLVQRIPCKPHFKGNG
jgi:four helix bundle protein